MHLLKVCSPDASGTHQNLLQHASPSVFLIWVFSLFLLASLEMGLSVLPIIQEDPVFVQLFLYSILSVSASLVSVLILIILASFYFCTRSVLAFLRPRVVLLVYFLLLFGFVVDVSTHRCKLFY